MKKEEDLKTRCSKLNTSVKEDNLCDYYESKRKGKYKTRCKNCVHFKEKTPVV